MSDTEDDGGDDGFDKEAEREKLREQYEREQKRREATQHMSELLLKGATMTNAHCEECGSPIFRHEGEEFCPTCAGTRAVDEEAGEGQATGDGQPGTTGESGTQAPTADASSPDRRSGAEAGSAGGDDPDLEAMRSRLEERTEVRSPNSGAERRSDPPRASDSPVRSGEVPSMAQSRASLRRAIVSLSEQAAQSDDPGRAHDLLKGAREAAEALAALEGTTGE